MIPFPPQFDKDSAIDPFSCNISPSPFNSKGIFVSDDLKLLGVVLIKEGDGHPHDPVADA